MGPEENLALQHYVRRPFVIQATEITEDNVHEVARHIGEVCFKNDGTPYIKVDRRIVPKGTNAYVGFFVTFINHNIRVFSRRTFFEQFLAFEDLNPDGEIVRAVLNTKGVTA